MSKNTLPILPDRQVADGDLLRVQKPAQYLGGEVNAIIKDDDEITVHFALAFPDTYEVGMSHLGIQILYGLINEDPTTWAERVYTPLPDMEAILRTRDVRLSSLESRRPLNDFDVVGFSLQYELCGTNILTMLELGAIPLLAEDRDLTHPIIIGGGPYCYHPEPLAPFFDAFFLGDAEEGIFELINIVKQHHESPFNSRAELLRELSSIEGVYVPSLFAPQYNETGDFIGVTPLNGNKRVVTRRLLPSMVGAPYPKKPVVPNIKTVHNRLSIEVMRGCVRGCRFCQAGYLYRPQRERSPQEILTMLEETLPETGYEELSLLSLSTADYCSIVPLLKALMDKYGDGDKLAISFPSTRVDALTPEVLTQVQRVRRTGFTVAPEAGTQRLRNVINKGVSDEQILETCGNVFRMGWTGIKLYFMLGNPTETDEDLQGIIDIARRIKELPEARGKDITVSVSTLVPKPHTPFQWCEQITAGETVRRQQFLSRGLRNIRVNFRYHDAFSSFLEGVFCRGDRRLSAVLLRAYELGCRLDAWSEHLDEEKWMQAFMECDFDPAYVLRQRAVTEPLPWDHLSCGIPKEYFAQEYKRALHDKETPDCLTKSCSICGACDYDTRRNVLWPRSETEASIHTKINKLQSADAEQRPATALATYRMRIRYEKRDSAKFLGHLETAQVIQRALRRSEVPLSYTAGFHPMPRVSFGPPLQLGVSSKCEYADLYLLNSVTSAKLTASLNDSLPPQIRVTDAYEVKMKAPSLQESISASRYQLTLYEHSRRDLDTPLCSVEIVREGDRKTGKRFVLSDYVTELYDIPSNHSIALGTIKKVLGFLLKADPKKASPRPLEVAVALTGLDLGEFGLEKVDSIISDDCRLEPAQFSARLSDSEYNLTEDAQWASR